MDWLIDFTDWWIEFDWLTDIYTDWQMDQLIDSDGITSQLMDGAMDRLIGWLTDWLIDWVCVGHKLQNNCNSSQKQTLIDTIN